MIKLNKKSNRLIKGFFVTFLVISWLLTGWSVIQLGPNFRFPPEIKEAKAAIALRGATFSTTATINKPTGVVSGDVLIAYTVNLTGAAITPPAGWVNISSQVSGVALRLQADRLVAGASEPASYTFTGASTGTIAAYSGVDNTTPVDVSSLDGAGGAGTPTAASLTTTAANEMLVAGFADTATVTWTAPTGMTQEAPLPVTTSSNVMVSDVIQVAAGASGVKASSSTDGTPNFGAMVALKNAGAAATTFTQNNYRWYVDNDLENVTDPWSANAGIDLAENTAITIVPVANDPPNTTQKLRLRVNFTIGTANLAASANRFKLQYRTGTDSSCSTGTWTDVNTGNAWVYATSTVADGTTLTVAKITGTNILESYVKSRPSVLNPNSATTSQNIEYDFHIVGTNSTSATRYLFRAVGTDAAGTGTTVFTTYTNCAILSTEPGTGDLMRHGNVFAGEAEQGFFWAN